MDPVSLDGLLEALPFPTMVPVYEDAPSPRARGPTWSPDLIPAAGKGPPRDAWHFEACGLAIALLLFLGLALGWRRRKAPSRARLLARAARPPGRFPMSWIKDIVDPADALAGRSSTGTAGSTTRSCAAPTA